MIRRIGRWVAWCATASWALGFALPASAQVFTGRIDIAVEDATGGRLPGVSVDLSGPVDQSQTTDVQGEAHFLNLPVGIYKVQALLQGFNTFVNDTVQVATRAATPLTIKLTVAGTQETVNVTAATPIIDVKRDTTTTNVTLEELQNIPTARDPWVILQSVPTIYVDRVNVGGSESGQQSNYLGKGSSTLENTWNIDGVPITDMGATGSTPTYYAFDMFQEMSVTTGGADAQNPTPGVQLSLVLKKGSNTPHGNASIYFENQSLQANNIPSDLAASLGGTGGKGNRTDRYQDESFDLGGPVFKDKLFAWGSLGYTDVRNLTLTSQLDETKLKNQAFKADYVMNPSVRANFAYFRGDKEKSGRGVGPTHLIEAAWNQSGPTTLYKGEGNFVVGQKLFATARYAYISSGFTLDPIGGRDVDFYKDDGGVWHNSYYFYNTTRPQHYIGGDASYFAGKHEVKFGFAWRKTPVESVSTVTGDQIFSIWTGYPNMIAQAQRQNNSNTEGKYTNLWVTDTISLDRLTVTAGIRFDHQTSSYEQTISPAIAGIPLMPQLTAPAVPNAYVFNALTPRVGVTYALDESRKTVARASYAMFASQLPGNAAAFVSPIQPYTYVYYNAVDRQTSGQPCTPGMVGTNGCNGYASLSEINFAAGIQGSQNVNLANPSQATSPNVVSTSISAPKTNEYMFGVDRELMPNFGVSATFTYRNIGNIIWNPGISATPQGYVQTGTFTGTFANVGTVAIPLYGLTSASGPGRIAENRADYHQRYMGLEISATKRMANKWMGRFGFATTSWNEYFDSASAILDQTPSPYPSGSFVNYVAAGPLVNGGPVVIQSAGSGKSGIYLVPPKYQFSANGLYEAGWGINIGANFQLREGYAEPYYRSRVATNDALVPNKNVLLTQGADQFRLDAVSSLDARVEKLFKFGKSSFAIDFDVFNLMNNATVLGKQYDARVTTYNNVLEIMNPRIARIGARFFF
jgi:hypothetical protein